MPSYEEQLAAYRAQLRAASGPVMPTAQTSPGISETISLAFNTLRQDLSGLAAMVRSTPSTPYMSDIAPAPAYFHPGGLMQSAAHTAGITAPSISLNAAQYQRESNLAMAQTMGDIARSTSMAAGGVASGLAGGIAFEGLFGMFSSGTRAAMLGRAISGGKLGASLLGGLGSRVAGTALGGTAGMALGGAAGGVLGAASAVALPAAAYYGLFEAAGEMTQHAEVRGQMRDYLQQTSWRYMGGRGFTSGERRDISKNLAYQAMSDRDFDYGEMQGILQTGTELGMFNATRDAEDFKRKFKELKEGLKTIASTMKVSLDEGMQLMAELKQGGFYTGAEQGAAAIRGAGLGFVSGFSAREMHEVGLRGAAMFRGTGTPTRFGFEMAQVNVAAVQQMQRMGAISQEDVNQMGGVFGAGMQMTQLTGRFMQTQYGRAMGAILASGPGGTPNQEAAMRLLAGENPVNILSGMNINPLNITPGAMATAVDKFGPQFMRAMTARQVGRYAEELQGRYPSMAPEAAFSHAAFAMQAATNVQEVNLLHGLYQRGPELLRGQRAAILEQMRSRAEDQFARQNTLWQRTGLPGLWRGIRREVLAPAAEPFISLGQEVEGLAADIGRWWSGTKVERVTPYDRGFLWDAAMRGVTVDDPMERAITSREMEILKSRGETRVLTGRQLMDAQQQGRAVVATGVFGARVDPEFSVSGLMPTERGLRSRRREIAAFRQGQRLQADEKLWSTDAGRQAQEAAWKILSIEQPGGLTLFEQIARQRDKGEDFDLDTMNKLAAQVRAVPEARRGMVAGALLRAANISPEMMVELTASAGTAVDISEGAKERRRGEMAKAAGAIVADIERESGLLPNELTGSRGAFRAHLQKEGIADDSGKVAEFLRGGGFSALLAVRRGEKTSKWLQAKMISAGLSEQRAARLTIMSQQIPEERLREIITSRADPFERDITADALRRYKDQIRRGVSTPEAETLVSTIEEQKSLQDVARSLLYASKPALAGLGVGQIQLRRRMESLRGGLEGTAEITPEARERLEELWGRSFKKKDIEKALAGARVIDDAVVRIGAGLITEAVNPDAQAERTIPKKLQDRLLIQELMFRDPVQAKMLQALDDITTILSGMRKKTPANTSANTPLGDIDLMMTVAG